MTAVRQRLEQPGEETGSAIAEFVMVSGLLVLLFLGCLQIAFALHVKNTVQDAASTGARYGTLRDRTPQDGEQRTRQIIREHLPAGYDQQVSTGEQHRDGRRVLTITVRSPLPVLGPWGFGQTVEVTGHGIVPS